MNKWNLIIDVTKCCDCNNCFLACKDEFCDNDFGGYSTSQPRHGHRWMNIMRHERGQCPMVDVAYLPTPCMHCDDAPCMKKAKGGAIFKRDDDIVIIDPKKAAGQKDLVDACPYHAIWWNDEKKVPQKCTFCAHLLDEGWRETRCSQACPTTAIRVIHAEDAEMKRVIASEKLEVLHPEYNTKPRVYYKNLSRYFRCFVGGTVAFKIKGQDECAEGVRITLMKGTNKVAETVTDNYGDFKFDNLEENSGTYTLDVAQPNYAKRTLEVDVKTSLNVGTIWL